jgi:hypothetical protein
MAAKQRDEFEEIADSIQPESHRAMLLLQESSRQANWRRAQDLIEEMTTEPVDCELVKEDYPAVIIFRLKPVYIRDAVLRLTEKGYHRLKAIDTKIRP